MENMKQIQSQQQQQTQGGEAMNKNQSQICFITFPYKLSSERAREVLAELRRLYPGKILVFTRKPPSGRKMIVEIAGTLTIITFPYTSRQEAPMRETPRQETPTQVPQSSEGGFTLAELAKVNKIKTKT